jgi:energy-coupling factor transport system permease protein
MLLLARLLAVLAGLAVLLDRLPRAQLISGLYTLAYPLHYLGVPRERIAVRLALTLDYAESAVRDTSRDWRASIAALINPVQQETDSVELQLQAFMLRDWLLLGVAAAVLTGALW